MVKKRYKDLVILIGIITSLAVTSAWLYLKAERLNQSLDDLESFAKSRIETNSTAYQNIIHNQHLIESSSLKKDMILIDSEFKEHSLDSLIEVHEYLLVLRFFWDTCEDCQIQEIELINEIENQSVQPIIIGSFRNAREFNIYMKSIDTAIPAFQLEGTESIFTSDEYLGTVFSFLLVKDEKQPRLVHVANSSFRHLSKQYYDLIEDLKPEIVP